MRYYIKYKGDFWDEIEKLPMEGKTIYDQFFIHQYREGKLKEEDVSIDAERNWIDIELSKQEATEAIAKGLEVFEKGNVSGTILIDGNDIRGEYCNQYSDVTNPNNFYDLTLPPYRNEIYNTGTTIKFEATNRNAIIDGIYPHINPSFFYTGIDKLHNEGFTGVDLKIGIIDNGVSATGSNPNVVVIESFNSALPNNIDTTNFAHAWGRVAQFNADNELGGILPDADVYAANFNNIDLGFAWLMGKNVDIINCSLSAFPSNYLKSLIAEFTSNGGIVCVAAGNELILSQINNLAAIRGVVVVGSVTGGNIYKFTNNIYHKSIIPVGGKGVDFLAPYLSIDPLHNSPGGNNVNVYPRLIYNIGGGTSIACPVVAGILGLLKQKYPLLSNRSLVNLLKRASNKVEDIAIANINNL